MTAARSDFDRDTAVRPLEAEQGVQRDGELRFAAEVSPDWHGARGPHGGYVAAIIQRALGASVGEERAPRSLTVHYARAPQPGPAVIRVAPERRGRSLSTLTARMEQDGAPVALALAAFSVAWSAPEIAELGMPDVQPPDATRESTGPLAQRVKEGLAPPFLRQLVLQPRTAAVPFSGSNSAMEFGTWLGLRDPARPLDAVALTMFCDVGMPPPFVRLSAPAMSSTIDLTIHYRTRLPRAGDHDPAELCFARLRSSLLHEGFFECDSVVWALDGTVLAHSRQLSVLMARAGA